MEHCNNCSRPIGNLETPCVFNGLIVCSNCDQILRPKVDTGALGLKTRKQALFVAILGILTAPFGIGLILLVWGGLAEWQMVKNKK